MAFSAVPTACFPNWSEDGTTISVPIATFPELTAAEADAATGDIRKIVYAVCEKIWGWWNALATADRPTKMVLTKSSSVDATTGIVTNVYTFTFKNSITAQDVSAEG